MDIFHDVSFKLAHTTISKTAVHVYMKGLSKHFFFSFGCYLCRKENKQINCFFPSFLPFPPILLFMIFSFLFIFLSSLFILSKLLHDNFSNYSSEVGNARSLNLHSAFNSCQGFTCIYQKWNVLYIMLTT